MSSPLDLYVTSYKNSKLEPILDFEIQRDGTLTALFGEPAIKQRAIVASFTQKGSIPQLPNTGVEWGEMLTGQVGPANINGEICDAIHNAAGTYGYIPQYASYGGKLIVDIKERV